MAHVDFSISGSGVYDLGANTQVTDIIGNVTALPGGVNILDDVPPAVLYRFGFLMLGTNNGFTGTTLVYYQSPIWVPCEQFAWNFPSGNQYFVQFIRWRVLLGGAADLRLFY